MARPQWEQYGKPTFSTIDEVLTGFAFGSVRHACWYKLAQALLDEGFVYNNERHDWVNDVTGERGRIACASDGTEAWLHHPYTGKRAHTTPFDVDGNEVVRIKLRLGGEVEVA